MAGKSLKYALGGLKALAHLKLLGQNYPLALRWQLLDRCDNRCQYCTLWQKPRPEMTLEEIKDVLNQVKKAGTMRITYSGGEPLLREDIGEIIGYTRELGISCDINTKGALIEKRQEAVKQLDLVKISLDGSEETHDFLVNKKGAFKQVMKAAEKCLEWGVKVIFTTTLTRHNLKEVDYILTLAEKYRVIAAFQPFKIMYKGSKNASLYPDPVEYRKTIERLIEKKRSGFPYLRNSLASLTHILNYPEFPKISCAAGKLFSIIDVDGTLLPCDRNDGPVKGELKNVREGYLKCFRALPQVECTGCGFLGARELSYFMNLKFEGMEAIRKVIKKK